MDNTKDGIYFSGLHGLRFFAALAVIITHIELIKGQMPFDYLYESSKLVFELGGLGVVFFFVLSGFLITYLLLVEKERPGGIRVGRFYMRRILRIWPVYFLVVALGFFVLPQLHFMDLHFFDQFPDQLNATNLFLFLFMLPNLAFAIFMPVPHIGQSWSIGIEEQFYLVWPWLVRRSKNILVTLLSVIVILLMVKAAFLLYFKSVPYSHNLKIIKDTLAMMKIESMAIGGIGAWMVFEKKYYQKLLSNYVLAMALLSVIALIYLTPPFIQDGIYLVYSALFLVIILNISLHPSSFIRIESRLFRWLGNISYGIYMYHMMVIAAVLGTLRWLNFPVGNSALSQLIVYPASILLSIGLAWLSYRYFENGFLRIKSRFTTVKSGEAHREKKMPEEHSPGIPSGS